MFAVLLNQRHQEQGVLVTASSARDVQHALERMIVAQRARRTFASDHVGAPSSAAMRKFISTRRCPTVMHLALSIDYATPLHMVAARRSTLAPDGAGMALAELAGGVLLV